ncbi:MAG: hypothetical protein SNJ58_03870 [Aggregatilineales bacterium]
MELETFHPIEAGQRYDKLEGAEMVNVQRLVWQQNGDLLRKHALSDFAQTDRLLKGDAPLVRWRAKK